VSVELPPTAIVVGLPDIPALGDCATAKAEDSAATITRHKTETIRECRRNATV